VAGESVFCRGGAGGGAPGCVEAGGGATLAGELLGAGVAGLGGVELGSGRRADAGQPPSIAAMRSTGRTFNA
jgi:hypothetical protein